MERILSDWVMACDSQWQRVNKLGVLAPAVGREAVRVLVDRGRPSILVARPLLQVTVDSVAPSVVGQLGAARDGGKPAVVLSAHVGLM